MFSLLPPEDFLPFVVPFQGGPGALAGARAARRMRCVCTMCVRAPPPKYVRPLSSALARPAGGVAPAHSTAWRHLAPAIARTSAAAPASTSGPAGAPQQLAAGARACAVVAAAHDCASSSTGGSCACVPPC